MEEAIAHHIGHRNQHGQMHGHQIAGRCGRLAIANQVQGQQGHGWTKRPQK